MMRRWIALLLALLLPLGCLDGGAAEEYEYEPPEEFRFVDTRFRGEYTKENLDAILEAYELNDGWYWVTKPDVTQNYHAHENKKGWTQSSKEQAEAKGQDYFYNRGWFGCRWECNEVKSGMPNAYGWGECFGFCQFLGYLLSGEVNPHGKWQQFNTVWEADGLRVGDIIRVEYTDEKGFHQHSAMVYSVTKERVRFIQCSGVYHNQLFINWGFRGANLGNTTLISDVRKFPGLRIHRAYNRSDLFEEEWPDDPDRVQINLVDLDSSMVVFLDPNDMRVWDVYDNWRQWSKHATEVDLSELQGDQDETEPEEEVIPVSLNDLDKLDNAPADDGAPDASPAPDAAAPPSTAAPPSATSTPPEDGAEKPPGSRGPARRHLWFFDVIY
ncbi:MAG: hypothetical protein IKH57_14160 [Clostridia bacterium]|nr:hypothetical protein [Clostridia bacterium]